MSDSSSNDDLFSPLTLCQTYRRAFAIFAKHWGTFLCLIVTLLIPPLIMLVTAGVLSGNADTETGELHNYGVFVASLAVEFVLYTLFIILAKASMMRLVAESYAGYYPSGRLCMKKALSRFPAILLYALMAGLIVFVSIILPGGMFQVADNKESKAWLRMAIVVTILCAVWLIYFTVSLLCAMPAIIVETNLSAIAAIKRAWTLSLGHFWYILGTMFLIIVATYAIVILLGPFGHIVQVVLIPIYAILSTVIYLNLRVKKESLTSAVLAKELGVEPQIESSTNAEEDEPVQVDADII